MRKLAIGIIGLVSGFFRALQWKACRFHPTCSTYAADAFRQFGFFKAFGLMTRRILRCHPFSAGGYDPLIKAER